jgi:manganese transport protein
MEPSQSQPAKHPESRPAERTRIEDVQTPSLPEVFSTIPVPADAPAWRTLLAFIGPGLLVAVGYMDPGNWATDLAGGARFGYLLLSVILISNAMATLLQYLSLKLGIVTGRDLAQACRLPMSSLYCFCSTADSATSSAWLPA